MQQNSIDENIISKLGELPSGTIIYEDGLAEIFGRCSTTIKRAVDRGEIPPAIRLFGKAAWLAGNIIDHIRMRLESAAQELERDRKRLSKMEG